MTLTVNLAFLHFCAWSYFFLDNRYLSLNGHINIRNPNSMDLPCKWESDIAILKSRLCMGICLSIEGCYDFTRHCYDIDMTRNSWESELWICIVYHWYGPTLQVREWHRNFEKSSLYGYLFVNRRLLWFYTSLLWHRYDAKQLGIWALDMCCIPLVWTYLASERVTSQFWRVVSVWVFVCQSIFVTQNVKNTVPQSHIFMSKWIQYKSIEYALQHIPISGGLNVTLSWPISDDVCLYNKQTNS
jgi:hypothetical protein